MIYLKNNTETQTIYIPRQTVLGGGYIATTKTYEDGYRDGLEDGKEQQKDKLLNLYVTENGQYEREDGWGVEKKFREGQKEQTLDDLFFVSIESVKKFKPKVAIFENVYCSHPLSF